MTLIKTALLAFFSIALMGQVQAATVQYILCNDVDADGNFAPGQFRITAKVSLGDNGGLSGYGMDLLGGILTLNHMSPRDTSATTATQDGPTGFTFARSADNLPFVAGFQDTSNPDSIIVYGFGQQANSFANLGIAVGGPTLEQPSWGAELLLATGTYSGIIRPTFNPVSPNLTVNVFVNATSRQVQAAQIVRVIGFCFPEPSTVALMAGMILGAPRIRRRRRTGGLPCLML